MESIKYSITVPVYNVEKYLPQCIESVLHQGYDNFELILVNDGSTDGSGAICDEYARKDSRIKVIHKENEGLLLTRRVALRHTTGDYVMFLDSDDYWENGMLKRITEVIEQHGCDMIIFNYKSVYPDREEYDKPTFDEESVFEKESKKELFKLMIEGYSLNNLAKKTVKRGIIDIDADYSNFADVSMGEDAIQSVPLIVNAKKIVCIPDYLYCYRRGVGMTSGLKAKVLLDFTESIAYITDFLEGAAEHVTDQSMAKGYETYLKSIGNSVVIGYLNSPQKLKDTFAILREHPFYRKARTHISKCRFTTKAILFLAEHGRYGLIALAAKMVEIKNRH